MALDYTANQSSSSLHRPISKKKNKKNSLGGILTTTTFPFLLAPTYGQCGKRCGTLMFQKEGGASPCFIPPRLFFLIFIFSLDLFAFFLHVGFGFIAVVIFCFPALTIPHAVFLCFVSFHLFLCTRCGLSWLWLWLVKMWEGGSLKNMRVTIIMAFVYLGQFVARISFFLSFLFVRAI